MKLVITLENFYMMQINKIVANNVNIVLLDKIVNNKRIKNII